MARNIENRRNLQFKAQRVDHVGLLLKYLLFFEFLASYLVIDYIQLQRMDLLVFRSWKHSCHTN